MFGSYLGVVGTVCNVLKETNVFSGPLKTPKDVLFSGTTREKKSNTGGKRVVYSKK